MEKDSEHLTLIVVNLWITTITSEQTACGQARLVGSTRWETWETCLRLKILLLGCEEELEKAFYGDAAGQDEEASQDSQIIGTSTLESALPRQLETWHLYLCYDKELRDVGNDLLGAIMNEHLAMLRKIQVDSNSPLVTNFENLTGMLSLRRGWPSSLGNLTFDTRQLAWSI